jgi:hypothetical protein
MVLYAQETLGLSAAHYGWLLTAGAVGGIFGGIIAERVIKWLGAPLAAPLMLSMSIVEFTIIATIPNVFAAAFALFLGGCTAIIWDTISVSNRQRLIPDAMLGRVNSMYRLMAWGLMPVGLGLSGLIIRVAEGPLTRDTALVVPFYVAAIGTAVLTALAWRVIGDGLRTLSKQP